MTRGYFGDPEATALAIDAEGWLDTGDLGVIHEGELYIAGRSKEIIFVNGQNYYPYDLENIAQRAPGWTSTRWSPRGSPSPDLKARSWWCSCSIAAACEEFLPTAAAVSRLINEHTGIEVAQVIPVKRIPKTTSGKVQRHLLETGLCRRRIRRGTRRARGAARVAHAGRRSPARSWKRAAGDLRGGAAGQANRGRPTTCSRSARARFKLIEIHENIDREFPGLIDLTELFDHPTIADLAKHLEGKLKRSGRAEAAAPPLAPAPAGQSLGAVRAASSASSAGRTRANRPDARARRLRRRARSAR